MPEVVISDSSCLIALTNAGHLGILHKVYGVIITTPEVVAEYGLEVPEWIHVRSPKDSSLTERFSAQVDPGEASAIALAMEIEGSVLILDDWSARRLAADLSLPHTGTVGVLLKAKALGVIPFIAPILNDLERVQFRLSPGIIRASLRLAGE
ncbi:MAG: DUF3368 domain-containing protein [Flavobacteriales bacterium]|nr:hypothetical protein [Flavobacteriales bacterium]MCC6577567.1 DUF3368 domain-containing protein [Flavobacteriales bacterium]NUQ14653.1 DUF3368 domain-containing protein [Flavobacteriales bacterium]